MSNTEVVLFSVSYYFLSGGDYKHAGFTSVAGDMGQGLICSKNI